MGRVSWRGRGVVWGKVCTSQEGRKRGVRSRYSRRPTTNRYCWSGTPPPSQLGVSPGFSDLVSRHDMCRFLSLDLIRPSRRTSNPNCPNFTLDLGPLPSSPVLRGSRIRIVPTPTPLCGHSSVSSSPLRTDVITGRGDRAGSKHDQGRDVGLTWEEEKKKVWVSCQWWCDRD